MTWQIVHKPDFTADSIELSRDLQQAVVRAIKELEQDPVTPRGNTVKKLAGYLNVWRYRLGDHRLIYAVAPQVRMLQLLAVGPRGRVYERFNYSGWDAPEAAVEFGPQMAAAPEWTRRPEWFKPRPQEPQKERLPRKLTPELLSSWRIDRQHHPTLMRCLYAEDLLRLADADIPNDVLERVMNRLFPSEAAQLAAQPDQLLLDPEDLLRYAEGTLTAFLLRLDDQQKPLASWALSGPSLVKGGPGSGKSTIALYRIKALVDQALATSGQVPSILFTTYTNALIKSSTSLLYQLLRDSLHLRPKDPLPRAVRVSTLHKMAQWIARHSGQPFKMAAEGDRRRALQVARQSLQPRNLGDVRKIPLALAVAPLRDDFLLEEFEWVIEGQNCQSLDSYLAADRAGRGLPLNARRRQGVWQLFQAYQQNLRDQGLYTWGYLVQFALRQVTTGHFGQRWDYVVVDEAQDLPPAALALCVELCRQPAGLFLTADANQSLYNRGFRWSGVHRDLNVIGRTRILRRNYRSTREIAEAARQIIVADPQHDAEAGTQDYVHAGPPPVLYAASGSEDQARWIARHIFEAVRDLRLPLNAAVVLVHSSSVGEPLAQALDANGLPAAFMSSSQFDLDAPCIKVTTLHAAKGLEFPVVVVAHVEAGRLPRETAATDPEEIAAFVQGQRRLFYVGCSRAMRYLFVTYDRQLPSPFLRDLTDDCWLRL